jgi:hypothetical protein
MNGRGFHPETLIAGLTFVLVGVLFALDRLGAWDLDVAIVWPVLLIGLGLAVLARVAVRNAEDGRL